ncbi:MAG: outer membrane protein assembly factor BamC, partial [Methylophilaceae bacterium]
MKKSVSRKALGIIVLSALLLNACGFSIPFIDNSSDYKKGGISTRPLEVPPDLTSVNSSDAYNISGSTSYSSYSEAQEAQEVGVEKVLSTTDGVRMEKAGGQRWLVVDAPAEKVWPVVREFWLDQGFSVRIENPVTGVMETEWVRTDDMLKVEDDQRGYLERFDKWMDKLSGLADKRKFRTRLERGEKEGTTEIYMTHRAVAGAPDDGK